MGNEMPKRKIEYDGGFIPVTQCWRCPLLNEILSKENRYIIEMSSCRFARDIKETHRGKIDKRCKLKRLTKEDKAVWKNQEYQS